MTQNADHRKIMSLGKTSTVISLPRKWLEINGLERGSRVRVDVQRDGSLLVSPLKEGSESLKEIKLEVGAKESGDSIIRRIVACFLDGYNRITLVSKVFSQEQQRAIRRIVGVLYMMVVVSESGRVVLQSLVDDSKTSVISCTERMRAITGSMCRDLLRAMTEGESNVAMSVVSIESDVDQLAFLVFRLTRVASVNPFMAEAMGLDPLDCLYYQTLAQNVGKVADDIEHIAVKVSEMLDSHGKVPEDLITSAEAVFRFYDRAMDGFLLGDTSSVNEVIEHEAQVDKMIENFYRESGHTGRGLEAGNSSFISRIVIAECLRRIASNSADIAELTIDRAYKM
jgi:phosphate uptake regulator